jgi:hypothetical protein
MFCNVFDIYLSLFLYMYIQHTDFFWYMYFTYLPDGRLYADMTGI